MGKETSKPKAQKQVFKIIMFLSGARWYKSCIVMLLALMLLLSVIMLAGPEILRRGIDAIQNKSMDSIKAVGIFAAAFTAVFLPLSAFNKLYKKYVRNKMLETIQFDLMNKVIDLKKAEFEKFSSGDILTNIINNAEFGVDNGLFGLTQIFQGVATLSVGLVYMAIVDWRLTVGVIIFNFFLRSIIAYFGKKIESANQKLIGVIKTNNSFIVDLLNNMVTVRTFQRIKFFKEALLTKEKQTLKASITEYCWNMSFFDLIWMGLKTCEYVVMYGFGGYLVYKGVSSIAVISAFILAANFLVSGINCFVWGFAQLKKAIPAIDSINEILENLEIENEIQKDIPDMNFVIRCENISFSFGDKQILNNVSFTIREKEKIMIKGENGSGKSTLLNIISGLYRPSKGEIYYGDYNIETINLDSLAEKYLYMSQNSNILEGSVSENLALSRSFNQELCNEILDTLNLSHIKNTDPTLLSQGEKQRLNIGRALYRQKDVCLVLGDEIFANIDDENVAMLTQLLQREFSDKTVIFVCHENIRFKFDRVFYVEQGCVKAGEAV